MNTQSNACHDKLHNHPHSHCLLPSQQHCLKERPQFNLKLDHCGSHLCRDQVVMIASHLVALHLKCFLQRGICLETCQDLLCYLSLCVFLQGLCLQSKQIQSQIIQTKQFTVRLSMEVLCSTNKKQKSHTEHSQSNPLHLQSTNQSPKQTSSQPDSVHMPQSTHLKITSATNFLRVQPE